MLSPELRQIFLENQWWGKVFGGVFGFLIAGPIGALFGILIGNVFDRGLATHLINPYLIDFKQESPNVRRIFYTSLFKTLGHLAKQGGKVSKREIEFASFMIKQLKLRKEESFLARQCFKEGKSRHFDLYRELTTILSLCRNKASLLQLFVETCFQMGVVDALTEQKKASLNLIFTRLGFKPYFKHDDASHYQHGFDNAYKQHQTLDEILSGTDPNDHQLLGVSQDASLLTIKKAYRKKMGQYHPDRLIAQNASKTEIKKATKKAQEIQAAYERLKKAHQKTPS